jgi:AAA15 family ATPase/GTPase
MLIEFRVENHRSVRDEQVLSMETPRIDGDVHPEQLQDAGSGLTVAAIYGANASGKSNILAALRFMRDAVAHSHRFWQPDGGVPRDPFAWGAKATEPSLYEVAFLLGGVRYEYGFVADDLRFLEEWLYAFPHSRKQTWFEREGDAFKFGEHLKGENRVTEKITRPNGLFLSAAVQNHHEQLDPIFRWLRTLRTHNVSGERGHLLPADDISRWLRAPAGQRSLFDESDDHGDTGRLDRFRELLHAADVGILNIKIEAEDVEDATLRGRPRRRDRVFLQHKASVEDAWLPLEQESDGTRKLFRLAPLVIDALVRGRVLIVDELETSFHPLLALHIVRAFNDPIKNPRKAQLIFSTHDTNLLGTTLGAPSLERSQVWLTEKTAEGATRLYPLSDYKPRKAENLERGYLQGRYGAIPFLGDIASVGKART